MDHARVSRWSLAASVAPVECDSRSASGSGVTTRIGSGCSARCWGGGGDLDDDDAMRRFVRTTLLAFRPNAAISAG